MPLSVDVLEVVASIFIHKALFILYVTKYMLYCAALLCLIREACESDATQFPPQS